MTQEVQWRATVTYRRPEQVSDEHLATLVEALPGYGVATDDGARALRLAMTVDAATLRQATEAALRESRAAYGSAFGAAGEPVEVRVLPDAEHVGELERPDELDLVGLAEVAQILDVSRQRAAKVAETHADFPAPVARPAMGPVYTRDSVTAFAQRWERKRTGRPRKAASE